MSKAVAGSEPLVRGLFGQPQAAQPGFRLGAQKSAGLRCAVRVQQATDLGVHGGVVAGQLGQLRVARSGGEAQQTFELRQRLAAQLHPVWAAHCIAS